MKFQQLQYFLERNACSIDHLIEDSYFATNCINGESCVIERLSRYSGTALVHYCYELGIPAPNKKLQTLLKAYREGVREHLDSELEEEENPDTE